MQQAEFNLTPELYDFLGNYEFYGFQDKNAMLKAALDRLKEELELKTSAELYAEIYEKDVELRALTEAALQEWPE